MAEKRKLAFYIRLSDADEAVKEGTKDESNSITGQRKLLYAYIKKTEEFAGFEVLEYFDDGYSGTMFNNRAEFQRLIQDSFLLSVIQRGKVHKRRICAAKKNKPRAVS